MIPGFFIPSSARMREDMAILRNNRRVKEYDERLRFGYNEDKGDYCIFMLMPHGEAARPILGFGSIVPEEDAMMERLMKSDTLRHGSMMREDINRGNERLRRQMEKAAVDEVHDAAERVEVWHRQAGTHPEPRVFVPDNEDTERVVSGSD